MRLKKLFIRLYSKGFTLVEMAVVLVIIGLTIGGLTATITAQIEHKAFNETRDTLENVREALLGYAMANGRLPCPAQTPGTGIYGNEYFATGGTSANGDCGQFYTGFVPAITLGVTPTNSNGYVLDAWGNPIHYAIYPLIDNSTVSGVTKKLFTATDGVKNANNSSTATLCTSNAGMSYVGCMSLLYVCDSTPTATAGASATDCGTANSLTSNTTVGSGGAVFVIYSTGKNGDSGGTGKDEAANPNDNSANDDQVFVSHDPNASGSTNGEFDDLFVWVSANTLFSKLVQANKLP